MGDLSPHFDSSEFVCKDGSYKPPVHDLIVALEKLRDECDGRPLRIVSGYRSPSWNAKVGGARNSQHLFARAADVPADYCSEAQAKAAGFTGIGLNEHKHVVHLDVRPGPLVVFNDF